MTPDIALVLGLVLAALAIPSMVSAFADARAPRVSAIMVMIGGALVLYAISSQPGGYSLDDIPRAIFRVIGQLV